MRHVLRSRRPIVLGLLAIAIGLGGCASLKDSVTRLTAKGNFAGALAALEAAGVGSTVEPKASLANLEARSLYQSAVERETASSVEVAAAGGRSREAMTAANEGVRLCPWSSALEATARERRDIVGTIDALALEWASGRSGRRDIINVRRFLERSAPLWQQIDDSPAAQAAVTQARSAIVDYWSEEIVPAMCRSDEVDMRAFDSDLLASGLPAPSRVALFASFARLHRLPWGGETAQPVTQQQIALIREVAPLATASTAETSGDQASARLERALGAAFIGEEVHGAGASPQFPKTSFQYIGGPNRLPLFFGQIIIP